MHVHDILPADWTRCAGRYGLKQGSATCARRETCARFLQLRLDAAAARDGISCVMHCRNHELFVGAGICHAAASMAGPPG